MCHLYFEQIVKLLELPNLLMGWIFNFKNCRKIEIEIQSHWFWIKASHAWVDVKIHLVFFFNFWYGFLIKQVLPRNSVVRNLKKGIKVKVIVFFINKILFSNFFNNWNIKNYGYLFKKKPTENCQKLRGIF